MRNSTVYIIGVFDLYHRGHLELLRRSRALGERLVVAVNSDEIVTAYKRAPVYEEEDRLALVKACKYVDEAFIIREFDNKAYLEEYQVDFIVHGDDWDEKSYMKQIGVTEEFLAERGITLKFFPYTPGVSTSGLIKKIKNL